MKLELLEKLVEPTGYDVYLDGHKIGQTISNEAMELAQLLNKVYNSK